jgi:hypothetical protein
MQPYPDRSRDRCIPELPRSDRNRGGIREENLPRDLGNVVARSQSRILKYQLLYHTIWDKSLIQIQIQIEQDYLHINRPISKNEIQTNYCVFVGLYELS